MENEPQHRKTRQMVILQYGQALAPTRQGEPHRSAQKLGGRCGVRLRMSAIRLSSGRERAFIFRMRLVRCTIDWANICSRPLGPSKRPRGPVKPRFAIEAA